MNQFKKKIVSSSRNKLKTPMEQILEILIESKKLLDLSGPKMDKEKKDVDWCIEIIASNKLYTPIIDDDNADNNNKMEEMNNWIMNYAKKSVTNTVNQKRRSGIALGLNNKHSKLSSEGEISVEVYLLMKGS